MNVPIVNEFLELIRISSPTGGERELAEVLKEKLSVLGLTVEEDRAGESFGGSCGNLIARLPATPGFETADCILFSAHMDRVPDGDGIRAVFTEDGRIVSDGSTILAADDLAGVCGILDGLRRLLDSGTPHGEAEIVFTVSEEISLRGSRALDYSRLHAKHGYCMDSSGRIGRIVTGAPAIDHIRIRIHGKSAHAGASPELGIDAIRAAAKFLANVREGRLDEESTANFGIIRAGNATNVICEFAEIVGEARSRDPEKLKVYEEYAEEFLQTSLSGTGATGEFILEPNHGAFSTPHESRTVQAAVQALESIGIVPCPEPGGGGMDANLFSLHGIESVGIATGYRKNHTHQEELYVEDLIKTGSFVEALIRSFAESR